MISVESRNPSQRQIAAALGISVSTVSRALSDAAGVSEELRQRVLKAAGDLGYGKAPRAAARPQRDSGTEGGRVGMFVTLDTFPGDSAGFYHDILRGADDELKRNGVAVDMVFVQDGNRAARYVTDYCADHPGCGVMLVALDHPDLIAAAAEAGSQLVIVNGWDPQMRADGVMPANDRGARLAADHLLGLGHRRIAIVSAHHRPTLHERFHNFRNSLPEPPAALLEIALPHPDLAFDAMRRHLAAHPLDFTAVLCGNDLIAVGVLQALEERGIPVPERCSVIGFDDIPLAAMSRPRLTTVRIDRDGIGRLSARRLLERMAEPDLTPVDIRLGCRVVVRESTAPAPTPDTET
ncbi:MAG TPA: LacI family DNA-binding transcriptional regulator [Geminicoccaceae bacterium]|nr:LacI family DNA-binding transcriptional regulator [Geminicoccus sp.]HMU49501.1 LacI family DNA-binding transcriptional regulator [Geminicoccaceae bacterium]